VNTPAINRYKNHRLPAEIISHEVWLYSRCCLSYRDVEELLFAQGVIVMYEAIRKFGQPHANQLRRRRPQAGDTWHLDEVFLTIDGQRQYLWRAVDHDGQVLDILVQRPHDKGAAKTFFRKLLKGFTYAPRVIITDHLQSAGAATDLSHIAIWGSFLKIVSREINRLQHRKSSQIAMCDRSQPSVPHLPGGARSCLARLR
jgi:putative transposase